MFWRLHERPQLCRVRNHIFPSSLLNSNKYFRGGDCHAATDGNFHHRHLARAGESPSFYEPDYFISKAQVDAIGDRIEHVRRKCPRVYNAKVPDTAIDECEDSHEAADGRKEKTSGEQFDDRGLMSIVCRHDIPLFFANIDSPGEQQKYAVALVEHLYSFLPDIATVVILYDVGCVLHRSLQLVSLPLYYHYAPFLTCTQYEILPLAVTSRLQFATSAMHAYGHQWACQLVYNPRLRPGLGLTDGEGTERLWSRLRKLISITRGCAVGPSTRHSLVLSLTAPSFSDPAASGSWTDTHTR